MEGGALIFVWGQIQEKMTFKETRKIQRKTPVNLFRETNVSRQKSLIPFFKFLTVPKSWDLGTVTSTYSKMCKFCPKMIFETVLERSSWWYSFKLQMSLSDAVYYLSFINWVFSIKTQKSSIFHVFYEDFNMI